MKSRSGVLVMVAAVLAVAYVAFFTDWFRSEPIRLSHRFFAANRGDPAGGTRIVFFLQPKQPISILKIIRAADAAVPKPRTLWHVVAGAKPVAVDAFDYGERIPGMKPFIAGTAPEPLVAGEEYIVRVEMGKRRGELRFTLPLK